MNPEFAHDHMPEEARRAIELGLYESARRLEAEGKLPAATLQGALTPGSLAFPLKARSGLDFDGFFGISWDSLGTDPAFEGEWTFEAEWEGEVTSRAFYYGNPPLFEDRFEAQ